MQDNLAKKRSRPIEEDICTQVFRLIGPLMPSLSSPEYIVLCRTFVSSDRAMERTVFRVKLRDGNKIMEAWLTISPTHKTFYCKGITYCVVYINIPITMVPYCYQIIDKIVQTFHFAKLLDKTDVCVIDRDLPFDVYKHQTLIMRDIQRMMDDGGVNQRTMMDISCRYDSLPILSKDFWKVEEGLSFVDTYFKSMISGSIRSVLFDLSMTPQLTEKQGNIFAEEDKTLQIDDSVLRQMLDIA
jgi:hypothetical protein